VQLTGEDLDVVPAREIRPRHAHRGGRTVVAPLFQAELRQVLDLANFVFLGHRMGVCVLPEILVSIERLRVRARPLGDLVLVDQYLVVLDPGGEFGKALGVVVFANSRIDPVVPIVHTAHEIVS
jgi:hypothetical protein